MKIQELEGNGSFDSPECLRYLEECDIVVTNPPFSLFRDFIKILVGQGKDFLVVGNMSAITYKEVFPLIKNNELWLGFNKVSVFKINKTSVEDEKKQFIENGIVYQKFGNICWFTNLIHNKRLEELEIYKEYTAENYPKYDNYDAIEVDKVCDIPCDYNGLMGVPITFLERYNPNQFEIIGLLQSSTDEQAGIPNLRYYNDFIEMKQGCIPTGQKGGKANGNPVLKGKSLKGNFLYNEKTNEYVHSIYARILIRRKR